MVRPPPSSTLFPTRRSSDLSSSFSDSSISGHTQYAWRPSAQRSEEHTSELQSLRHLVCRLLLEKKKYHSSSSHSRICRGALKPYMRANGNPGGKRLDVHGHA